MKVHAVISVEDVGRNEGISVSRTNFLFQLTQPIKFPKRSKNKQYFARIENIRIPITFYNINSTNNVFTFDDDGTDYVVTIPPGNYTIDELITDLQVAMNATASSTTYTITYDEQQQTINIGSDGGGGVTTITNDDGSGNENTLYLLLGFDIGQTIADGGDSNGNQVAYTNTARHLRLVIDNMNSNNCYVNSGAVGESKTTQVQKVGVIIPITETRNEFQFYKNDRGYMIKLPNIPTITELRVKLLDAANNIVDLNNVPWGFDCVFYEWNKNGFGGQQI